MAKVRLNPVLEAIRGKVGDLVFKEFSHKDIVSRMPDRTGIVPTADQVAQTEKFRLGVIYGKSVIADPQSSKSPSAWQERAGAIPVRVRTKDRTETTLGAAQKDTARLWAAKAA